MYNKYNRFGKYVSTSSGQALYQKWYDIKPEMNRNCPLCGGDKHSVWYDLVLSKALLCTGCGFKFISPILSEKQMHEYYSHQYHETTIDKADFEGKVHDVFNNPIERDKKIKDRHVEISLTDSFVKNGSVLDIGCGSGLYFEGLKGNHNIFGIETSKLAAQYTSSKFNINVETMNIDNVEYEKEMFDVINMTYLIEHLVDPAKALNKILYWLKKDGMLIVSSPNWGGILSKYFKEFFRLNYPIQHINLWDVKTLTKFLNNSGFIVKNVYWPYFKTEYFNLNEIMRLFRNSLYYLILPLILKIGYVPSVDKILSPPFWGNIMVLECYKTNVCRN
tara:strand:+ start:1181 stop:2179 length:999 start_codon:yes stop_codon:yes gene_type:complete